MEIKKISDSYSATGQINLNDLKAIHEAGFKTIFCFRPKAEDKATQIDQTKIKNAAKKLGIKFIAIPVIPGNISQDNIASFTKAFSESALPALGYCRSGGRASGIYNEYLKIHSLETSQEVTGACNWSDAFDVVVVGGGAAGIGITASLLKRRKSLRIAVIEPSDEHYYQPAWTLVGGGTFDIKNSVRPQHSLKALLQNLIQKIIVLF